MAKLLYSNTHDANMLYAVGVEIPDPFYCIDLENKRLIFLDGREYGVFLDHNTRSNIEAILLDPLFAEVDKMEVKAQDGGYGGRGFKLGLYLLKKYNLLEEEIEISNNFPIGLADFLRGEGVLLTPVANIFPERLIKSTEEIKAVRESLTRTHEAFKLIEDVLQQSKIVGDELKYKGKTLTSEILKIMVDHTFVDHDMMNLEGIIISCGPHAAIPHHRGAGPIRPHQTIICDIFPRHKESGYFADMTRTYVKGESSEHIQKMYQAVLDAQSNAINAITSGVAGSTIHQMCADHFEEAGFATGPESGFMHGTGHGLGLDIHEAPYLSAKADAPLAPGHVVTVEPGLYYPEHGGVRIEDVVAVTENGCKNLTDYHKNYIID